LPSIVINTTQLRQAHQTSAFAGNAVSINAAAIDIFILIDVAFKFFVLGLILRYARFRLRNFSLFFSLSSGYGSLLLQTRKSNVSF